MKTSNWVKIISILGIILALLLLLDIVFYTLVSPPLIQRTPFIDRLIWGATSILLFFIAAGFPVIARVLARRRQAEEALAEQRRFLSQVIDADPNAIFVRDRTGCYVLANTKAAEFVGLKVEELIGTHDSETNASQEQAELYLKEDQKIMDTLEPLYQPEMEVQFPGGITRWLDVSKLPLVESDGTSSRILVVLSDISERKQAEEALLRSEAQYRAAVEDHPGFIYRYTPDLTVTFVNKAFCDFFGFSPEDALGHNLLDLVAKGSPDNIKLIKQQIANVTPENPVQTHEHSVLNIHGEARWVRWIDHLLLDENGQLLEYQTSGLDITDRRQSEEALLRSEALYRAVVEDHPGFIYRYTPDYTITFVNKAYCDFFGYRPQEILGRSLLDIVELEGYGNKERARQQITKVTPENPVNTHEHGAYNAQGEPRWIRWIDRLLLDEDGEPLEYQSSGLDITDRQQAEAALEEQRRFLRQIIDANPNIIFVRDYAGRYVLVNKAATEIIGAETGEVIGKTKQYSDFSADHSNHFLQQDREVMDTGQDLFVPEEEITLPNGEKRWVQVSKQSLAGPLNRADQVLVVLVDITERKKIEASMVDAEKLAGLGTLAAGIAHEINSPLQIITGKTESLQRRLERDQVDADDLSADLGQINRNAWRVAQIVRSLLDYAHPVSGETHPADLNSLVKDTLLLIEHQLKTWSNITVDTELAADLPSLYCTSEEISRVLINLLTNARDAMPGGGQITIRTRHDMANRSVILEVADTGLGIPEDILSKIYDPFFTTKAVGQGTGLGLFIVYGIVQSHGGKITIDNRLNEGAIFKISLPVDPPPATEEKPGRYQA